MNPHIGCFLKAWLVPAATVWLAGQTVLGADQPYQEAPGAATAPRRLALSEKSAVQRELEAIYLRDGLKNPPRGISGTSSPTTGANSDRLWAIAATSKRNSSSLGLQAASKAASTLVLPADSQSDEQHAAAGAFEGGQDRTVRLTAGTEPATQPEQPPAAETDVQRQLKALYEKDGREMPSMNISELPVEYAPPPQYGPLQQSAPPEGPQAPPKQPSFLKRIFSFSAFGKKPAASPVAAKRPAPNAYSQPGTFAPPGAMAGTKRPTHPRIVPGTRTAAVPNRVPTTAYPPAIAPPRQLPPLANHPLADATPVNAVPPVEETPRLDLPGDLVPVEPSPVATPVATNAPLAQPSVPTLEESPFSGLKLQTPEEGMASLTPPPNGDLMPPSNLADSSLPTEDHSEKFRILASVPEKTGFKGFCPVSLKNQRELVPAKDEFESVYRSRKFHFSSVEAKAEFDKSPAQFAPAVQGLDIVLLAEEDEKVEGALDHAAWYQGRLYLFAKPENLAIFVAAPQDFAEEAADAEQEPGALPGLKAATEDDAIPELKSEEELEFGPQIQPAATDKKAAPAASSAPTKTDITAKPASTPKPTAPAAAPKSNAAAPKADGAIKPASNEKAAAPAKPAAAPKVEAKKPAAAATTKTAAPATTKTAASPAGAKAK